MDKKVKSAKSDSERPAKNLVIHVGQSKALSTFLQKRIFPFLTDTYFEGSHKGEQNPITLLIRKIIAYKDPLNFEYEKERRILHKFIQNIEQSNVVISCEALFGNFTANYRDKKLIIDLLKDFFPQARILIILRCQDQWLESMYKQLISIGYSIRVDQYLNYEKNQFGTHSYKNFINVDVRELNYFNYVKYCIRQFGQQNVIVMPFEAFRKDNTKYLQFLYDKTELPHFYPESYHVENKSLSLVSSHIALWLNRFLVRPYNQLGFIPEKPLFDFFEENAKRHKAWERLAKVSRKCTLRFLLQNLDRAFYIKHNFIDQHKRDTIRDFHSEDNRKLSKLIKWHLQEYGYF